MPVNEIKAVLERAISHWNRGDLDGYLRLYHPEVTLHGYQGVEPGIAGVKQFYQGFWSAFPGSQIALDDMVVEGNRLACRFTLTARNDGSFMGLPPTGKAITLPGITILHFAGDQCIERWSQSDFLGLMQQLGMLPAMG